MALNFPSSPTNGDTFEGYIYNDTTGTWDYNDTSAAIAINDLSDVNINTASTGQTITFNGTDWVNTSHSKNILLNGGFDIWQRGITFSADGYCADRWYFDETGTCTVDQETVDVPTGFNYSLKANATTVNDSVDIYQCLEQLDVVPLRGKTVTFSCYLKMDSNMISQTANFELKSYYSNTTDARASQTTVINNIDNATSTILTKSEYSGWKLASHTFTVPTDAVGLKVAIEPPLTSSPTAAVYYVTGAQLELGAIVTPFRRNSTSLQAELASCQRYYYRWNAEYAYDPVHYTLLYTSTGGMMPFTLPATPRIQPNVTSSGSWRVLGGSGTVTGVLGIYGSLADGVLVPVAIQGTSLSGSGILTANNNANSYIEFDMEL